MQSNAYISDVTTPAQRSMRMLILEMTLGIGGGLGSAVSGVWAKASGGFFQPMIGTSFIAFLALCLLPLLPNSQKIMKERQVDKVIEEKENADKDLLREVQRKKSSSHYLKACVNVYTNEISHCEICFDRDLPPNQYPTEKCIHGGGRYVGRKWKSWSYLIIYNGMMAQAICLMSVQTLFVMSKPLCFNNTLVGLQIALKFIATAFSPLLILFLQKVLSLSNDGVILICIMGSISSFVLLGFSFTPWMVFVAMFINGISMPAKPFAQSQLSKLVSEKEHGAAFSVLSFTELLTFLFSTVVFLTIYKQTVSIMHGMTYLIATSVLVAPLILNWKLFISSRRSNREEKELLLP